MKMIDRINYLIKQILDDFHKWRKVVMALSCIVVFITTYLLILPAFTLEKEKAFEQGGIDLPQTAEAVGGSEVTQPDDQRSDEEKRDSEALMDEDDAEATDAADLSSDKTDVSESENTINSDEAVNPEVADQLIFDGDGYSITVSDNSSVLPEDTEISVDEITVKTDKAQYEQLCDDALAAVQEDNATKNVAAKTEIRFAKFYDIKLISGGEEITPDESVSISITYDNAQQKDLKVEDGDNVRVIHFAEDKETGETEAQILDNKKDNVEFEVKNNKLTEAAFDADSFSVYAVVYTVDFHYEIDGKQYEFCIPGGGAVNLSSLIEVLGIADPDDNSTGADESTADDSSDVLALSDIAISDETRNLIADIERVEFSSPDLAWVGKAENDTTVGALKEANGLEVSYSAELTEEQIEEIDSQEVDEGDWALISLLPFDTEETLTVTLITGEVFTIKVTDAQDPSVFIGKEVIIYDNGEQRAMITTDNLYDGYRNRFPSIPVSEADGNAAAHWTIERNNNNYYLKSSNNQYLTIDGTTVGLVNNWSVATPLGIQAGTQPDYRIYAANNYNNVLTYEPNGNYDGFFSAPGGTYTNPGDEHRWLYIREVETVPDRAGDWMLYFDDDFNEITIHVGETITLRPYDKWQWADGRDVTLTERYWWGNQDIVYLVQDEEYWNVGNWDSWAMSTNSDNYITNGAETLEKSTDGVFEFTRYIKRDSELLTFYWSVQGFAKETGDYILTNTEGKEITVHVVDGDPVNKPGTIDKIANIKVNLFDYDNGGRLDEGLVNGEKNHNLANDNNFKGESVNQMGGSDHFYFLSSGSGTNNNEPWNNYTNRNPNTNIVESTLNADGYPVLNHGDRTSLQYLFDTSEASQTWHGGDEGNGMIAYPDVVGMFQKDSDGYYYYNSNTNYFYYDPATGTSKLYEHTYTQTSGEDKGSLVSDKPIGFFPFHDYDATSNVTVNQNANLNHHVGMSMDIEFMLSNDRLDDYDKPIIFDFSGDDDLWVFVEWEDDDGNMQSRLLLDMGGVHQPIHGQINFTDGENTQFINPNQPYTLKVFYLERGGCDSNCSIRFNLPIIQDLAVAKKLTGLTEAEKEKYEDEEFTYEIVVSRKPDNIPVPYNYPNPDNRYEKVTIWNADGEDITPDDFTIENGRFTLKDGQTLTISYLDRSDKFTVAELKTPNMENFEVPNAERYYHQEHDASLYEEEITLRPSQTLSTPVTDDWVTPEYTLEDTEKVTFTNTLKEKNLEVEKKWNGGDDHPDSIDFTVSATVDDGNGGRIPYAVSELKNSDGTDKVFTLNDDNDWRHEIEHLPVNTPDGKFIFYDINEGQVEGYILTGLEDITADEYNVCNVDVVKLWPDSNVNHTEVLQVVLKNSEGKYYKVDDDGNVVFVDDVNNATIYTLNRDNNYTHRFDRVPYGEYTAEQLHEDEYNHGLATYIRPIIQYELENSPIEEPVDPEEEPNIPVIHKRIDALRDGVANPDSAHAGEDLTDLYRLYLDYKINAMQDPNGVDLLLVIDHSGSMNNSQWPGNQYRATAVMNALNGEDGLISKFLAYNDKNQWAAVGFKGPDGTSDYTWSLTNPWEPSTDASINNAGVNGSEVLSPGSTSYLFTRQDANVALENEGASILSNYTAGFWRAEQFLLKPGVEEDGRKKVIVFITDGVPTLHIGDLDNSLQDAGTAAGSSYYREDYGGCPEEAITEFGYFAYDMQQGGYVFGDDLEFYTIGLGASMQTAGGADLLDGLLDEAYGDVSHDNHYMTIADAADDSDTSAANTLMKDLRIILGMNDTFSDLVIRDDLSKYVDLFGLEGAGTEAADIMRAAKAKVTMTIPDPDDPEGTPSVVTLYENGAPATSDAAKFTKENGDEATIIQELSYDADTKTVSAVFDPDYHAAGDVTYTLSFDVEATETAYSTYAASGYDKYTSGENQGQIIVGDPDTDFLGTDPANATSVDKEGFRSNDEAKATYDHNGREEEQEYPHPVIQVAAKADLVKIDETGAALEGAKFNLYDSRYDASKTIEENADYLIEEDLQSKKPTEPAGEDAVIHSGKLLPGTYYLVETEAPAGYIALSDPVKITVTETNGILNMVAYIADEYVGDEKLVKSGNGVWMLKVQNSSGAELPYTGGIGTTIFYVLGTILVLSGSIYLIARRRAGLFK